MRKKLNGRLVEEDGVNEGGREGGEEGRGSVMALVDVRPNGFQALSRSDGTILFLVIVLDKAVSVR